MIWFTYDKFNLFTVYNSMVLSMFSKLYSHDQLSVTPVNVSRFIKCLDGYIGKSYNTFSQMKEDYVVSIKNFSSITSEGETTDD